MVHYGYGPRFPYPWAMRSKLMIACRTVVTAGVRLFIAAWDSRGIRAAIPHARRNSSLGLHGGCGWSAVRVMWGFGSREHTQVVSDVGLSARPMR